MFNLFKNMRTDNTNIYAPVEGKCIDITQVKDPVFSKKTMGDGVAIVPESNIIQSPCSGTVTMLFPTKHAFGITTNEGLEVLIHIGIDTVNLNGKGFQAFVSENQKVKKGDKIIKFNDSYLADSSMDMTTIVVITNGIEHPFNKNHLNENVCLDDMVISLDSTKK